MQVYNLRPTLFIDRLYNLTEKLASPRDCIESKP